MAISSKLRLPSVLALTLVGLGACQTIAGIEERTFDPNFYGTGGAEGSAGSGSAGEEPSGPPPSEQCQRYCSDVMSACQDTNAVYTEEALCLGVCALLEPGDPLEPVGNNVACRARQARLAMAEPADHCRFAGPGGDGQCGSDCEAYCQLFAAACADVDDYTAEGSCMNACEGLTNLERFDVIADHEGDTLECRLVHVSSATVDPETHCSHSFMRPTQPWCTGKPEESPTCEQYCDIVVAACDDDLAQYETHEQCMDACGAFELGRNDDQLTNTIACRRYHAFSSTLAPAQHCPHAGPSGDGHCGDVSKVADGHTGNCESYCAIMAAACPTEFATTLVDADECMAACIMLDEAEPESKYSVANALASTALSCRILNAVRSFADPTACSAALGVTDCN